MNPELGISRKRHSVELQNGHPKSFNIQPHMSSSFEPAVRIILTVILPYNHIPLHWIAGLPSRFFAMCLEFSEQVCPGDVAIVKIEGERQLSMIERLEDGIYTLYRLSTQVKMKEVRKLSAQLTRLRKENVCSISGYIPHNLGDVWWNKSGTQMYPFSDHEKNIPSKTSSLHLGDVLVSSGLPNNAALSQDTDCVTVQPSMLEVFGHLRCQYYQTLYLSKTSLAYFSKSALSRARAVIQAEQPCPPLKDLVSFLETMLVPLEKMDRKYRTSLVRFASEETIDNDSDFQIHEDTYVQRWRSSIFGDRFIKESDAHLKEVLAELRTRETELQVILLLEILALKKNINCEGLKVSPTKFKRKHCTKNRNRSRIVDSEVLLELLIDRLCIWHSIGSDTSDQKLDSPSRLNDGVDERDHLRHFCIEVLMPFYGSKLPEKCASINNKLAGQNSGSKRPRDPQKLNRRGGSRATPTLKRSATTPELLAVFDKEKPEHLSTIAVESLPSKTCRGGTLNNKNFSKRVIQLDQNSEPKKTREDLRDAIKAITKPNRIALATELAEYAEKRQARGNRRKPRKSMRPTSNTILVTATPQKRKGVHFSNYADENPNSPISHSSFSTDGHLQITADGGIHDSNDCEIDYSAIYATKFKSVLEEHTPESPAGGVNLVMATPLKNLPQASDNRESSDDIYRALGWSFSDDL